MQKIEKEITKYINLIEAQNLRTKDKLTFLRKILLDYHDFREIEIVPIKHDIFQVIDLINRLDMYLNRKRLGKSTENDIFKEVKKIALIRLRNTKMHFQ